jgi:hypothetical protein
VVLHGLTEQGRGYRVKGKRRVTNSAKNSNFLHTLKNRHECRKPQIEASTTAYTQKKNQDLSMKSIYTRCACFKQPQCNFIEHPF